MDRRKFLKVLGIGSVAAAVTPAVMAKQADPIHGGSYSRATPTSLGGYASECHPRQLDWSDITGEPVDHWHSLSDLH